MRSCRVLFASAPTLLQLLVGHVQRGDFAAAAALHETKGGAKGGTVVAPLHEARDVACVMMRVYTSLGKKEQLRGVYLDAVESIPQRYLNTTLFDHLLEALTKSKFFSRAEVQSVLEDMSSRGIPRSANTYLYLIEFHLRMDLDPQALWEEMLDNISDEDIAECCVHAMVNRVLPASKDPKYVVSMIRQLLASGDVERVRLVELLTAVVEHPDCAPEHAVWVLFELEQRCLLASDDSEALPKIVQPHTLIQILYKCAKSADVRNMELLMGLVDRHGMTKTADMLGLVVVCYSHAEQVERALDIVELMGRKGMLDLLDPFRKFTIDAMGIQLDRHYLMSVSDAMGSVAGVERGYQHLLRRLEDNRSVTVHTLDLVVLAASKCREDARAVEIIDAYGPTFKALPRTISYNCLLISAVGHRNAQLHHILFDKMEKNGIPPNNITFRFLIRHCLQCDDVFGALEYVRKVAKYTHIRVDVEMILPIFERSARAGDAETAIEMSQLALDCDIGIDPAVMNNVMKLLQNQGQPVTALQSHCALHEALRARSKGLMRRNNNGRTRK